MPAEAVRKQLNVRVGPSFYRRLEALARQERRTVPQTALLLLEEALRSRGIASPSDDTLASDIAALATEGGGFQWLADEPDLYDDRSGEPV